MSPVPLRSRALRLLAGLALGGLGLLPGAAGAGDGNTLLGWLALCAPALGARLAGGGAGWELALVPSGWTLAWLACADTRSPWPPCVVAGLFAAGVALGRWRGCGAAGAALHATLLLAGLSLGFGVLAGGAELAPHAPVLAARLLDLSPLVLVFDAAGSDWLHAQPEVYARAGVEWFPRRPWSGNLAGPTVLVVGCLLAVLARPAHRAPAAAA